MAGVFSASVAALHAGMPRVAMVDNAPHTAVFIIRSWFPSFHVSLCWSFWSFGLTNFWSRLPLRSPSHVYPFQHTPLASSSSFPPPTPILFARPLALCIIHSLSSLSYPSAHMRLLPHHDSRTLPSPGPGSPFLRTPPYYRHRSPFHPGFRNTLLRGTRACGHDFTPYVIVPRAAPTPFPFP